MRPSIKNKYLPHVNTGTCRCLNTYSCPAYRDQIQNALNGRCQIMQCTISVATIVCVVYGTSYVLLMLNLFCRFQENRMRALIPQQTTTVINLSGLFPFSFMSVYLINILELDFVMTLNKQHSINL